MNEQTIKFICAVAGVVILEVVAISQGIDGVLLSASIASVVGLFTYQVGKAKGATT